VAPHLLGNAVGRSLRIPMATADATPVPDHAATPPMGRKLALLLALPLAGIGFLLAALFAALAGDRAEEARAAGALERAASVQAFHLAALQHRDAVRDLLAGHASAQDVEAAADRLDRARQRCAALASPEEARALERATARARQLAGAAAWGPLGTAAARAGFDDAYAREVLPAAEDGARVEADRARAALSHAQAAGRRRLLLGAILSLLSLGLAAAPATHLARRLSGSAAALREAARRIGRGDLSHRVPPGLPEISDLGDALNDMAAELELSRSRELVVQGAEARLAALEEARADLEARVEERTRALARTNADLHENLRRLAEAQQKLMASDRLAAIGQLAASVAHDVNNPISCVTANLRFVAEEVRTLAGSLRASGTPLPAERESEIASALDDARDAAQRVSGIVRDLRTIARGEAEPIAPVDLREAIEAAVNVAQGSFRPHARLERKLDEVPPVWASASRLGQVFLPLLLLASRAIAARGPAARGTIRLATTTGDDGAAVAEVRDDGAGLSPGMVARLFDPFAPPWGGAGPALSLAVAHGLVTSLGGTIDVQSQPGAGTRVRVVLPAARPGGADTPARLGTPWAA